jgi:hypothetical protein
VEALNLKDYQKQRGPEFKDGDDDGVEGIEKIYFELVDNGFIMTIVDEEGFEYREVYQRKKDQCFEMMDAAIDLLGIKHMVRLEK